MTQYEVLNPQQQDDEIDLRELFATLWAGKWLIIAVTFLFAAGGVAYALYKPNIYQASVLLAPANEENGMGGISGQLGGLASLAGINIGGGSSNQTVIAKEVLRSRAFLADFIDRHNLAVPLMAVEGWSIKQSDWQYNREVYNPETGQWLPDENGKSQQPTDWDLVKAFKQNHLSISENKENGMVTFSVKSLSPPAAQQWAQWLVEDINEHMRRQDVAEAEARINYLENKLTDTNIAGMQQVFYQLIESETRTVMLANAQQEYVFKTIDPAVVPQEKSEPKRALIAILATMLGGMLGVFIVFIRAFFKGTREA
ncbi:Wzz/FepE/Etk N-terminal domain-containing protein [Marinobacter sp. Arc7-DN-1]|uniref:Wzz/FepE/Etk N-terminal domain-containing protein n=1 Tax=Marinobacter sp. Arc7-DN-1 TaxID=2304594 RepID=UPI000E44AD62|nr:Wzz/FepE/Etk N-terminal domain-containing protein [Marinobacter sp. Arc7-DN-1]AXS82525.1 LPS O-antigen length regulator [Marinobacter sp. Arc7-DN-1]